MTEVNTSTPWYLTPCMILFLLHLPIIPLFTSPVLLSPPSASGRVPHRQTNSCCRQSRRNFGRRRFVGRKPKDGTLLPDGYSRIFRIICVWPFGLLDYGSATLHCKIWSLPFLGLRQGGGVGAQILTSGNLGMEAPSSRPHHELPRMLWLDRARTPTIAPPSHYGFRSCLDWDFWNFGMSKPANYNVKRWFDFAQVACLFGGPLLKDICSQIFVAFALFNSKGHFVSGQLGVSASPWATLMGKTTTVLRQQMRRMQRNQEMAQTSFISFYGKGAYPLRQSWLLSRLPPTCSSQPNGKGRISSSHPAYVRSVEAELICRMQFVSWHWGVVLSSQLILIKAQTQKCLWQIGCGLWKWKVLNDPNKFLSSYQKGCMSPLAM